MKHAWKIINFILALVILGVTLGNYDSLSSFVVVALADAVLVLVIDFLAVRRVSSTRVDYLLLVLPGLFLIGLFAAISATSALGTKLLVAVLALDVFYIHQSYFPKKPPAFIEETFTLTTSFLLLYGLWAINFFLTPAWWKTMALAFAVFLLLFYQAFYKMGNTGRTASLHALLASLLITEIFWTVLFAPVYFLTAAVLVFAVFYLIYMLSNFYFERRLSRNKIVFHTSLIFAVILLSLASSPWQP